MRLVSASRHVKIGASAFSFAPAVGNKARAVRSRAKIDEQSVFIFIGRMIKAHPLEKSEAFYESGAALFYAAVILNISFPPF